MQLSNISRRTFISYENTPPNDIQMSNYSRNKFFTGKILRRPFTFLFEVSNYSRRLFEKSLAKYPRKLAVTFQYIWGCYKFFLKKLVFAIAKRPIIVGSFFETSIFWNLVSLDIWKVLLYADYKQRKKYWNILRKKTKFKTVNIQL